MQPIVNMSEEERATDICNMRKKIGKDRACGSGDILANRQTDTQTDILITIQQQRRQGHKHKRLYRQINSVATHLIRRGCVCVCVCVCYRFLLSFSSRMPQCVLSPLFESAVNARSI